MKLHESLAQNHSIRLQAEAETWQEAVKIGGDLLVAADVVEPRYYQAILDGVAQHAVGQWQVPREFHDPFGRGLVNHAPATLARLSALRAHSVSSMYLS